MVMMMMMMIMIIPNPYDVSPVTATDVPGPPADKGEGVGPRDGGE
jgi:hypothetical protein